MKPARLAGVVFGAVLLLVLLAAALRGPLLRPLLVLTLRQSLGLNTTIAQIEGSILTNLEFRGVNARGGPGSGPLVAFAAERISARYDLAALLHGTEAFLDSLEVTVSGAGVELDQDRAPAGGAAPAQQKAGVVTLPRLPRLTVRDSRVKFLAGGYAIDADALQCTVARADQAREQAVELQVGRFSLRHPALREGTHSLAISARYAPRQLTITAAGVNGEPLVERARLDLGAGPGEIDLELALKLWQGSVQAGMRARNAGNEIHWDARGLELQPHLLFVNPALGALRGKLSTNGTVTLGGGGASTLAGTISLEWKGAEIAGVAVDQLAIQGSAAAGVVLVERAAGRIGPNEVLVHRTSSPAGPLLEGRWRALLGETSGSFSAALGDVPALLALWGAGPGEGASAVPAHQLHLEGSLKTGTLRLARGDLATGLGKATLDGLTVTFPRDDQGWGETAFSGGASVDLPNLKDVSALFPMPALAGSVRGTVSGTGTFSRPEGQISLTGRGIGVAGRMVGDVDLRAQSREGRIEVDSLHVRQGGNSFTAEGVRFSPTDLAAPDRSAVLNSLAGSFALRSTDIPALAALAGLPAATVSRTPATHLLTLAGTVRDRSIAVTAGSFAAAGGTITLRAAQIALPRPGGDWVKDTNIAGELEIAIPDLAPVAAILQVPPLKGALKAHATVSGSAVAPDGSVEISGRGLAIDGHLIGDLVVKVAAHERQLNIETLEITRGKDRLHGSGAYDLEKRALLAAEAEVSLADVAPYLVEFVREGYPVSGRLHGTLHAVGTQPGAPLALKAVFSEGRIGPEGHRAEAALDATYEPGLLRIGAFELTGPAGLAVKGEGTLPLDFTAAEIIRPGPFSIKARANIPALEDLAFLLPPAYALAGTLSADVAVTGSWKEPEARLEIRGERLRLPPGTRFAPPDPFTFAGTLTWGAVEARAEKVRLESPALSFSLSGAWSSPPPLAALFAGDGGAATGSLSLRTSFSSPDIVWLQKSVEGLRGLRGSVAGEIAVDGPAGDPVFSGEIRIADGAFRYRNLQQIDTLVARLSLARRSVNLKKFGGNVGGSPFTLAGSLDFSRLDDLVLDLRLLGKNVLLYRSEELRVRADSDLTLRGPVSALSLTGEMALTNSIYQKDITVASLFSGGDKGAKRATSGLAGISFPEPPLRNMRFDVRLTSREPLQIKTTVLRGSARPDMRLTGTGLLPILRGPILFDTAGLILPSGTLELDRGTVLYREGDPDRPTLDFGGRMQSRGYEITAQIGGTLDSPEVILSSIPPLPREELLLFVLTGAPPGSGDGGSFTAMASPMAVYLGKNVVGQLLGGKSRAGKTAFQDRIELQIGREMTHSGSVTIDARLLLQNNPIGQASTLYLTSEKDVYDQYNAGLKILFKFK